MSFGPRLPPGIAALAFRLRYRGRIVMVEARGNQATYTLLSGEPLNLAHHGQAFALAESSVSLPIPPITPGPRPSQPVGRAPQPHRIRD